MKIVPKSFLMPSIKYLCPISEVLWPVRRQTISTTCLKSFEQVIVKRSVFFPARLGGEKFNESWLMMICPLQKKVEKKYSYEKMAAGITVLGKAYVTPAAFWGRSPVFVLPGIFPGRIKQFHPGYSAICGLLDFKGKLRRGPPGTTGEQIYIIFGCANFFGKNLSAFIF